jgi:hypothetical protein
VPEISTQCLPLLYCINYIVRRAVSRVANLNIRFFKMVLSS